MRAIFPFTAKKKKQVPAVRYKGVLVSPPSPWNSLEITKLALSALTPILVFVFGVLVSRSVQSGERAMKDAELARQRSETRQVAVQNLSRFIYERRSRAEMLASALRRDVSIDEIRERKKLYDETYVKWNTNHQANLLLIRQLLGDHEYSDFESLLEFHLVGQILKPLDGCLTAAYDARLRDHGATPILDACSETVLLQRGLDCGYALTNELFRLSSGGSAGPERNLAANVISERCGSTPP